MAPEDSCGPEEFPSTRWSVVLRSGSPDPGDVGGAFETITRAYFQPIVAYLRAVGHDLGEDPEDLAQGFFAWLWESGVLSRADRDRGRFRAFLKVVLRNYMLDFRRRQGALKRGGAQSFENLDDGTAGAREIGDRRVRTPEQELDEMWRRTLVERALLRTEEELIAAGKPVVFAVFRDYFLESSQELDYRGVAARHGITTVDVSNYLSRAKRLYREHLRALVQETVLDAEELRSELEWLFGKGQS